MNYQVTVLGLGDMGLPWPPAWPNRADVHGFDIAEPRLRLAEDAGVRTFASASAERRGPTRCSWRCATAEQLDDVLFGENGVARYFKPAPSSSSAAPVGTDAIPDRCPARRYGVSPLTRPSGWTPACGEGDLLIVVGAEPQRWKRPAPFWNCSPPP